MTEHLATYRDRRELPTMKKVQTNSPLVVVKVKKRLFVSIYIPNNVKNNYNWKLELRFNLVSVN